MAGLKLVAELARERGANAKLRAENERLRAGLNEVVTNGQWTEGEQRGDWAISAEVYQMARAALEGPVPPQDSGEHELNEKLKNVTEEMLKHISKMLKLFKPGAKITVIVRHPSLDPRDASFLSNDNLGEVITLLENELVHRTAAHFAGGGWQNRK